MISSERIYNCSPWWIQNLLINSKTFLESLRPTLRRELRFHRQLLHQTEKVSQDELERRAFIKLRSLLIYCSDHVPYYRRVWKGIGFCPQEDIRKPYDIRNIPILSKEEVRKNYVELVSDIAHKTFSIESHTSGTTGTPLQFKLSMATEANYAAHIERHRRWHRYDPRGWCASLGGKDIIGGANSGPLWRYCLPKQMMSGMPRLIIYSALHLSTDRVRCYIKHMRKKHVRYLKGYPSNLFEFAKMIDSIGEEIEFEIVFTGSEPLHDHIEDRLKSIFKVSKIADFYGNSERSIFSYTHPDYDGYFIATDSFWSEFIDAEGNDAGTEMGEIIGTNLFNYVMPLVRYRTGDYGRRVKINSPYPFPSMDRVYTKFEDVVIANDGSIISPSSLTHPFKEVSPGVLRKTQIKQARQGHLSIYFVRGDKFNSNELDFLEMRFNERFEKRFRIDFCEVDEIDKDNSGKYRWVINESHSYFEEEPVLADKEKRLRAR